MTSVSRQRCANHPAREAVSKCVSCHRFFCRECVTEHDERMLCSACLARLVSPLPAKVARAGQLTVYGLGLAGLLISWALFYFAGDLLATATAPAPVQSEAPWR